MNCLLIGESDEEDELIIRETIRHELGLTNVKILPADGSGSSEIFY